MIRLANKTPGKDIAILKMDGDSALPTLKVAQDELPKVGEQLFVYGFPGPVTNNNYLATESAIVPTLTTGIVSALKKSVAGWPLIQMDANINLIAGTSVSQSIYWHRTCSFVCTLCANVKRSILSIPV